MPSSDKLQKIQLMSAIQRDILDPNAKFWGTAEILGWVDDWQTRVQEECELVWGSATSTTTLSTLTLTAIATDILRLDAVYYNQKRMLYKDKGELDLVKRDWRAANSQTPIVYYQDDPDTVSFWPPATGTGTVVCEYPKKLTFAANTSTHDLPAFTKYSAIPYGAYRAYKRHGPNQSSRISQRRRAQFERHIVRIKAIQKSMLPDMAPSLRPSSQYERDIVEPQANLV